MNVVGYCRFSSEGQRDGYSIEAQKRAINEYCEREGHTLLRFYVDEARSGTNDNREQFQDMIADAATRQFKAIIVHKFDRFARNKYDSVFYKRKLRDFNVKLISILEPLDDSPEAVILESLYEGMSDYYSKNLSREVLKGKKEAALKCQHNGGIPPYGFTVDKNMHYIIVPAEAEIIRTVFEQAELGLNHAAIARYLNERGLRNRAGNRFGREYITRMITNELYKGTFVYAKNSRHKNDRKLDPIKVENAIEAIVSPMLWDKINKVFNEKNKINSEKIRKAIARNSEIDYLLTGYTYCGCCGSPLTGFHVHKNYKSNSGADKIYSSYFYRCAKKNKRETILAGVVNGCSLKNIRKDNFEDFIFGAIENIIFNEKNIQIIVEKAKQVLINKMNKKQNNSKFEAEIGKINKKLDNLLDLLLDGTIEKNVYNEKKDELEKLKKHYQNQIRKTPSIDVNKLTPELLMKTINKFLSSASADTIEYKKKTLSTFVDNIIVDNEQIVIYFKFPIIVADGTMKSEFSFNKDYFLLNSTTVSTSAVCGNISKSVTSTIS